MRTWLLLGAVLGVGFCGGVVGAQVRAWGAMPLELTRNPEVNILGGTERLGYLHAVVQRTAGVCRQL